jgi:hypothetical protein
LKNIVTLTIAGPDEEPEDGSLDLTFSIDSKGPDLDAVVALTMQALFSYLATHMLGKIEETSPGINGEIADALSSMNARIQLMDAVIHAAEPSTKGFILDL